MTLKSSSILQQSSHTFVTFWDRFLPLWARTWRGPISFWYLIFEEVKHSAKLKKQQKSYPLNYLSCFCTSAIWFFGRHLELNVIFFSYILNKGNRYVHFLLIYIQIMTNDIYFMHWFLFKMWSYRPCSINFFLTPELLSNWNCTDGFPFFPAFLFQIMLLGKPWFILYFSNIQMLSRGYKKELELWTSVPGIWTLAPHLRTVNSLCLRLLNSINSGICTEFKCTSLCQLLRI